MEYFGNSGAGVVFYCKETMEILLGLRSYWVNEPNTWGTIGGKLEEDEHPKDAVRREVREEAHITGNYPLKLFYIYKDKNFRYYNFLVIVKKKFIPKISDEISKFKWFHYNNLPKNLHFGMKYLLPNLRSIIEN